MTICPTPPTVMPSVGDGTGDRVVQVPCAYPDCAAVKVASAPAARARSHFRRVQEWSNIFFPPLDVHEWQSEGMRAFPCAAEWGGSPGVELSHTGLFAPVRSVLLSIAAARQGSPRSDWPPERRHEPRKRRRPS